MCRTTKNTDSLDVFCPLHPRPPSLLLFANTHTHTRIRRGCSQTQKQHSCNACVCVRSLSVFSLWSALPADTTYPHTRYKRQGAPVAHPCERLGETSLCFICLFAPPP